MRARLTSPAPQIAFPRDFPTPVAISFSHGAEWKALISKYIGTIPLTDTVPDPKGRGYMVNVASYQHGVGYDAWTRVHGFSEAVIAWIAASEETKH